MLFAAILSGLTAAALSAWVVVAGRRGIPIPDAVRHGRFLVWAAAGASALALGQQVAQSLQ